MIASISSSESCSCLLEFQSLDVEVVAKCFAWRCSWRAPPFGLLFALVAIQVLWLLPLLDKALRMFVVEWLFGLFRGPDLRPLAMSLRSEAPLQASSWVEFYGRSLEFTNGGCQCWVSIAEG
jgi:hypothetical protein